MSFNLFLKTRHFWKRVETLPSVTNLMYLYYTMLNSQSFPTDLIWQKWINFCYNFHFLRFLLCVHNIYNSNRKKTVLQNVLNYCNFTFTNILYAILKLYLYTTCSFLNMASYYLNVYLHYTCMTVSESF